MMGTGTKSVNVIESHKVASNEEEVIYASFDEEVRYISNQYRLAYQGTN